MRSTEEKAAAFFASIFFILALFLITSGFIKGITKNNVVSNTVEIDSSDNDKKNNTQYVGDYFEKYDSGVADIRRNDPFADICKNIEYGQEGYVIQSGVVCFK